MRALGDTLEAILLQAAFEIAKSAVEEIKRVWPVDSGVSRDSWFAIETQTGAAINCEAEYSSYVFAKGDSLRTPIYGGIVARAVNKAIQEMQIDVVLADATRAYIGQGRTTSHITGVHRKMVRHTPPDQVAAWRENFPEMIEEIEVVWHGKRQVVEIVPSDTIASGGAGVLEFRVV